MGACTTISRDSAPSQFPDVSDIANAEPYLEPSSKMGNPKSYVINGIRYFPQKERGGFSQTGIASWYGTKFHGRLTSNGEVYDMYKMTAAHKTLPLPTYVKVSNLENGKSIMVRVNDRGPFVEDRVIDLSYVAAIKLGMTQAGTARVRVDVWSAYSGTDHKVFEPVSTFGDPLDKTGNSNPSVVVRDYSKRYFLQLGSFANLKNAKNLESKLLTLTEEPVKIAPVDTPLGKMYRVQLGPFEEKDKLISVGRTFDKLGYTQQIRVITSETP